MLKVDENDPGLSWMENRSLAKLLALHHVATVGRYGEGAFSGASLIGFARHRARVEATFVPPGWGGLTIRATWSPTHTQDGVDLEVQISATRVSELNRVEVGILSRWGGKIAAPQPVLASWVEPRDIGSAALSYDGRESASTLQALTTLPVPPSSPHRLMPRIFAPPEFENDTSYIEMVQPNDCARRIISEPVGEQSAHRTTLSTRYGLFGLDLDKGVVLRARLRGLWIQSQAPEVVARARCEEFLREPPPLGP
jgi:hypothetical protein